MATNFLRYPDLVERKIIANRTTLARWIRDHGFPAPLKLGPNSAGWLESEIDAWIAARAAAREVV